MRSGHEEDAANCLDDMLILLVVLASYICLIMCIRLSVMSHAGISHVNGPGTHLLDHETSHGVCHEYQRNLVLVSCGRILEKVLRTSPIFSDMPPAPFLCFKLNKRSFAKSKIDTEGRP